MPIEPHSLKESSEFMNLLLDNINSAVLIADEKFRIHQFNKGFLNLFDRATDRLDDHSFGQVTGCVNAVQENKSCGETSKCRFYATLLELYPQSVADMVDGVFKRFKSLRGDVTPNDDMSLLAIEFANRM